MPSPPSLPKDTPVALTATLAMSSRGGVDAVHSPARELPPPRLELSADLIGGITTLGV